MLETDLYQPILNLLQDHGYHIKAEINHIDIFGTKDNQTIAVEMKNTISLKLIYQAVDRLQVADLVYIAVPEQAIKAHRQQMKYLNLLLKKLNIGLISVSHDKAEIYYERDQISKPPKKNIRQKKIMKEFNTRENHMNIGGTKDKKVTAYKEKVIRIAHMLDKMKQSSPNQLKAYTGIDQTAEILRNNFDGWFERIDRGIYTLSDKGQKELSFYRDALDLE